MNKPLTTVQKRFRTAMELHDFGVAMMRHRFRRENRSANDDQIEQMVLGWLRSPRTGSPGDAEGREVAWPRTP